MSPKFNIKNIGFIGLGVMGMPMCINLSKKEEFNVTGFDINKEKNKIHNFGMPKPIKTIIEEYV